MSVWSSQLATWPLQSNSCWRSWLGWPAVAPQKVAAGSAMKSIASSRLNRMWWASEDAMSRGSRTMTIAPCAPPIPPSRGSPLPVWM